MNLYKFSFILIYLSSRVRKYRNLRSKVSISNIDLFECRVLLHKGTKSDIVIYVSYLFTMGRDFIGFPKKRFLDVTNLVEVVFLRSSSYEF
jgi:hypothetical protein